VAQVAEKRIINLQLFADDDPPPARSTGGGYSAEYVQDLRNENASWRTKLRAAEEENAKLKTQLDAANKKITDLEGQNKTFLESVCSVLGLDASKTKPEDIPAKIKEALGSRNITVEKAQEALRKSAFIAAAVKQGVRKEALEDAYKLADFSNVKVDLETMSVFQVDKDGKQVVGKDNNPVTGLDSLVENLVKEKSYLLGKSGNIGGSSNPGGGGQPPGEPEGFGTQLGKKQKEQSKKSSESQNLYFPD
jgi:hypothetical protein